MRRWWLVLLLLLSLGLNLGVVGMLLFEKSRPKPPDPRQPEVAALGGGGDLIARLPRFANHLGLEGEERRKFLDIQVALFQETTRLRLRMAEIQRSLRLEMTAESTDPEKADKLLRESAEVYLQMERAFVRSVVESRQLLGQEEERRYLQVLARLRATTRGQLGLANPGEEGGAAGRQGPLLPRDRKPFQQLRRQRLQEGVEPGGALEGPAPGEGGDPEPPGWQERPRQGGIPQEIQERRRQKLEWRLRQRERLQQQRRPPGRPAPPQGQEPPPPVY